jgi:hypothetical protein
MRDSEHPESESPKPQITEPESNTAEASDAEAAESARRAANEAAVFQGTWLFAEYDRDRALRLAAFNRELGARLASLARGECVDAFEAHQRRRQRSRERTGHGT